MILQRPRLHSSVSPGAAFPSFSWLPEGPALPGCRSLPCLPPPAASSAHLLLDPPAYLLQEARGPHMVLMVLPTAQGSGRNWVTSAESVCPGALGQHVGICGVTLLFLPHI